MKQTNKNFLFAYLIGVFALVLANGANSMDQAPPDEQEETESTETLDEVTVYGRQSMIVLRKEFELAQENMFVVFNDLNSTDEFDVECDYVQKLGSRRWHHVCEPKFATRQINQYGTGILVRDHNDAMDSFVSPTVQRMNRQLWDEMTGLINKSPELRKAFADIATTKNAIEAEQQRRRED